MNFCGGGLRLCVNQAASTRIENRTGGRTKKPPSIAFGGLDIRAWQFPTFAQVSALSSALSGFTSEVGMGSGGSRSLWPPGKTGCSAEHGKKPQASSAFLSNRIAGFGPAPSVGRGFGKRTLLADVCSLWLFKLLGCYMVKPHGQLVLVSFTHY